MDRKRLFKILFYLIFFIFIANFLANKFYWYTSIWYFDMIMHFLGGFWVGLLALYLFYSKKPTLKIITTTLLLVLFIGIGWEVYEVVVDGLISHNAFNTLDTMSDIFFDLSGGTFSLLYFFYISKSKITKTEENRVQSEQWKVALK
ncbi:MAG: hypothetical protein ACREGC_00790 [Minisyncoccia bacterium]